MIEHLEVVPAQIRAAVHCLSLHQLKRPVWQGRRGFRSPTTRPLS